MEIPDSNRYSRIGIFDLFDDGEQLWFTSTEYNSLFKINKQTFKTEYVGSFPNEEWDVCRLYTSINEYEGRLFFTPCAAHEIGVYDTFHKQFRKINIGISKSDNDISKIKYGKKFVSGFIYNNTLILIPCCYDKMIIYDISNDKVYADDELFKHFYKKYKASVTSPDLQFYLCWFAKKMNESEIVFNLHCNRNIVVIYNLATRKFIEREAGDKNRTFSLIEYDGKYVFLYDEKADILLRWEKDTDKAVEFHIKRMLPEFQPCGLNHSFVNMVVFEDWLYLIPANTNAVVRINVLTMEAFTVSVLSNECSWKCKELIYLNLCRVFEGRLYLYANRSKRIIVYGEDKILQIIKTEISLKDKSHIKTNYMMYLMDGCQYLFDENTFSLNNFISVFIDLRFEKKNLTIANTKLTGSIIYECINDNC